MNDDFADSIYWCPDCGEPAEVCVAWGRCPLGRERAKQEAMEYKKKQAKQEGV